MPRYVRQSRPGVKYVVDRETGEEAPCAGCGRPARIGWPMYLSPRTHRDPYEPFHTPCLFAERAGKRLSAEELDAPRHYAGRPSAVMRRPLELRRRILAMYAREDQVGPEAWWRGTCDSVCYVIEEEGLFEEFADAGVRDVTWGAFRRPGDQVGDGHCFLILADGTIVDPTSRQFGLEECAVVPPDDPRHSWYVYDRASTDATASHVQPAAARALASERSARVGGRSAGTVPATS